MRGIGGLALPAWLAASGARGNVITLSGARGVPATGGGGGGGGDNSALGNAMRGLSVGSWGTFTLGNTFNPDPSGSGDSVFSFSPRASYHNGKVYHLGGCHGTGANGIDRMFLNIYDVDSNMFTTQVHWPGDDGLFEHAYYNGCIDLTNGDFLGHNTFGSKNLQRWQIASQTFGSDISPPPTGMPSSGGFYSLEWHPSLAGGSLIWSNEWDIAYRPASTGTWTELDSSYPAGMGNPSSPICYNPKDDCVYIGGQDGNGSRLQKITAGGALVVLGNAPGPLGVWDATGSTGAMLIPSGGASTKMLMISRDKNVREYDDATDSWSSVIETVPTGLISGPGVAQAYGDCCFCSINDSVRNIHGILAIKLATSTTVSTTAHLRRAA